MLNSLPSLAVYSSIGVDGGRVVVPFDGHELTWQAMPSRRSVGSTDGVLVRLGLFRSVGDIVLHDGSLVFTDLGTDKDVS